MLVEGSGVFFSMEVVTSEGSVGSPVLLFEEKSNWCQVNTGSSFYRFGVSSGQSYTVKLIPMSYNVSFEVFNSGNFTNSAGTVAVIAPDAETLVLAPSGNAITVRVDDASGNGATYVLRAYKN